LPRLECEPGSYLPGDQQEVAVFLCNSSFSIAGFSFTAVSEGRSDYTEI